MVSSDRDYKAAMQFHARIDQIIWVRGDFITNAHAHAGICNSKLKQT